MSGLRITGGELRGRTIPTPFHSHRPTSSKARQAFFNMIATHIRGARFLDLFAGSGAFSLEAASRGAEFVLAVDTERRALESLGQLAVQWKAPVQTLCMDALKAIRALAAKNEPFGIVYADPPYEYPHYAELLQSIDRDLPLEPEAVIGIEHHRKEKRVEGRELNRIRIRKTSTYGEVAITTFELA